MSNPTNEARKATAVNTLDAAYETVYSIMKQIEPLRRAYGDPLITEAFDALDKFASRCIGQALEIKDSLKGTAE